MSSGEECSGEQPRTREQKCQRDRKQDDEERSVWERGIGANTPGSKGESCGHLRWGVPNNRKGRGKGPEAVGCQRVWEKPERLK